jgi:hypothetical protein
MFDSRHEKSAAAGALRFELGVSLSPWKSGRRKRRPDLVAWPRNESDRYFLEGELQ